MDTIAAISTPLGEGGIGIVRISGESALEIADRVFRGRTKLSSAQTHTVNHGKIIDPRTKDEVDEVLAVVMRKPQTYTREDMVEIDTHGGTAALSRVLEVVLHSGARHAEPGEFTRRAFLSGRIDLAQAEAVLDVVAAKTDKALSVAISQLDGKLSGQVNDIKEHVVDLLTLLEASIDFPEDVDEPSKSEMGRSLSHLSQEIDELLKAGESGKLIREGATIPIVGRTNVGKSSLFNALLSEERAIVTPHHGTTRDTVEAWVNVNGIPAKLVDTAGLRKISHPVEREGVKRTRKAIDEATLTLFVVDQSEGMQKEDEKILRSLGKKKIIGLLNKCDLVRDDGKELQSHEFDFPTLSISALRGDNMDSVFPAISELVSTDNSVPVVSKARHIDALRRAGEAVTRAQNGLKELTSELIAYELKEAISALGEITGEVTTEAVLDRIFSEFCLGK
jgi:tRNA modification GTPase